MRDGTYYAKRVKRLFSDLKREHGAPAIPEPTDPVRQLVIGLLSSETPASKASQAAEALFHSMVDLNEIRVSTIAEIAALIHDYVPNAANRAGAIRAALNAVFRKHHKISLASLHKLGLREARQYLEKLKGVDAYTAASVMLWSLGGHAIPVDRLLYERLRAEDLVNQTADLAEVQAFLERNISAADAKEFCLLMRNFVESKPAGKRARAAKGAGSKASSSAPSTTKKTEPGAKDRGEPDRRTATG